MRRRAHTRSRPPSEPSTGDLRRDLIRLDGQSYSAYKSLQRRDYSLGPAQICLLHVQGDPFASPSRLRVELPPSVLDLPSWALAQPDARRATADLLHRRLRDGLGRHRQRTGSGKSGLLEIMPVGPEILSRTALMVRSDGGVIVNLCVGLPAAGRRILGHAGADLLTTALSAALQSALGSEHIDRGALARHVRIVEDQVALRAQLAEHGLVAFLAESSHLPRQSGVDDRPMANAVPLEVPPSLAVTLRAPHAGALRGLGVPQGVTLIVGGGYHGKSTLLSVIAQGVYDHVPNDGREQCVTRDDAVWARAEDGRAVRGVDLRPFISDLPLGRRTDRFDTDDASGSTSQAAAIVEALEAGAGVLLIDEDTAATNFMIRDVRMRRLVPPSAEPITPYLDRVGQLYTVHGVSSVLVVGGAGDYLDVADTVIQLDAYRPHDVTERARQVAAELPLGEAAPHPPGPWSKPAPRVPDPSSFDARRGRRAERVRSVRTRSIEFGEAEIDVSLLAQLCDPAQCRMIGDALLLISRGVCDGRRSVAELLDEIDATIEASGLVAVTEPGFGDRARARRHEIAAALNRLRSLRLVKPRSGGQT